MRYWIFFISLSMLLLTLTAREAELVSRAADLVIRSRENLLAASFLPDGPDRYELLCAALEAQPDSALALRQLGEISPSPEQKYHFGRRLTALSQKHPEQSELALLALFWGRGSGLTLPQRIGWLEEITADAVAANDFSPVQLLLYRELLRSRRAAGDFSDWQKLRANADPYLLPLKLPYLRMAAFLKPEKFSPEYQTLVIQLRNTESTDRRKLLHRMSLYLENQLYEDAHRLFLQLFPVSGKRDDRRFFEEEFDYLCNTGRFDKALKKINAALAVYPWAKGNAVTYHLRLAQVSGNRRELVKYLEQERGIDPFWKAEAALLSRDYPRAEKLLTAYWRNERNPAERRYCAALSLLEIAEATQNRTLFFSLKKELLPAARYDAEQLNNVGYVGTVLGVELEECGRLLERALELEPLSFAAMDSYGWNLFRRGKTAEAKRWLNRSLYALTADRLDDAGVIFYHLGEIELAEGKKQTALAYFRRAAACMKSHELEVQAVKKRLQELEK